MRFNKLFLVAAAIFVGLFARANAAACDGSKSAFMDAISNDSHNINTSTDLVFGETKTLTATVGPDLLQRAGAQAVFTAPGSGSKLKTATITITTSAFAVDDLILNFAVGPMSSGFTSCEERLFPSTIITSSADDPTTFKANQLEQNNGKASYVYFTSTGAGSSGVANFGVIFKLKVLPGRDYEATCGTIQEKNSETSAFDCNITIEVDGATGDTGGDSDEDDNDDGDDDNNDDDSEPIEIDEDAVKVQSETTNGNCLLTAEEHLEVAIKTEQAIKARLNRFASQLEEARTAVSDAGVNPGPAIRRLDALVEFIRDDINEARDAAKGGLRFSKRHLVCSKQKALEEGLTDLSAIQTSIDNAIAHDDEAIEAVMTEDSNLNEESVRIKATLENTVSDIDQALEDKEDAGQEMNSSFTMPDFESDDVNDAYDDAVNKIDDLKDQLKEKIENIETELDLNDKFEAFEAVCNAQVNDCIIEFFDDIVAEYIKLHTAVNEALVKQQEADEAQEAEDRQRKQERARAKSIKRIQKTYVKVVKEVRDIQSDIGTSCEGPFDFSRRQRRRIRALLEIKRRAEIRGDKVLRRLVVDRLEKEGFR